MPHYRYYKDIRKDLKESFKTKTDLKPSFFKGDFKSVIIFVAF